MMDKTPSPYPGGQGSAQPGQAQESEMIYNYSAQPGQVPEPEVIYEYLHPAGFPQPEYSPAQPLYSQGYTGIADYANVQQPDHAGYASAQQPVHSFMKKSWNTLWIVLTTLALLVLLAIGSLYYYFLVRSTPERTLQTYCSAVKNQDGRTLYTLYSKGAQALTDEAHLQQGLRLIEFISGGIEDCSIDNNSIHENDPQATARVTFTLYNGRITGALLHLINEDGQWRVETNAILP